METGRPRWHLRELEVQTPGWVVLLTYNLLWPSFPLLQERWAVIQEIQLGSQFCLP